MLKSESLEALQEAISAAYTNFANLDSLADTIRATQQNMGLLQEDYDKTKLRLGETFEAMQHDTEAIRNHITSMQEDVDAFKGSITGAIAAVEKDSATLQAHIGSMQTDNDVQKKASSESVAALQKDAETLRQHVAGVQEDVDLQKTVSSSLIGTLQKDAEALRRHVAGLQEDHDRIAGMAGRSEAETARLKEAAARLTQLSSDFHHDLTRLADAVSRLGADGAHTP